MSKKVYAPDARWHEMERGGIIPQAGNADEYSVGGWRNEHPIRDNETCIDCLFCWIYCPDVAVRVKDESVKGLGFDPDHCKGCAICAEVCPVDAIKMVPGGEFQPDEPGQSEEE
ncbi:MAG: 4Fe-4S dicluster-binding protein [Armatimonadota bacterium]